MADRSSPGQWRLYVITDEKVSRGRSHLQVAEAAIRGGADVLQLRDKEASSGRLYRVALQLRVLTRDAKGPFIVNHRLDMALATDAERGGPLAGTIGGIWRATQGVTADSDLSIPVALLGYLDEPGLRLVVGQPELGDLRVGGDAVHDDIGVRHLLAAAGHRARRILLSLPCSDVDRI